MRAIVGWGTPVRSDSCRWVSPADRRAPLTHSATLSSCRHDNEFDIGTMDGACSSGRRQAPFPTAPGSYQFKDKDGRVIYVGKAHSLRSRLSNYFVTPSSLPARTAQMVAAAESVEWIQVRNDVEALMLEYNLIKQHRPRFNIRLRDDKSYPFLAITVGDQWPRAMVMRGKKRKDTKYFGPFGHAYAIRETLDLLLRTFPIRTCSDNKFGHHERLGRPCLLFHIEKCTGPCVGEIDERRVRPAGRSSWSSSSTATPSPSSTSSSGRCGTRPTPRSTSGRPACRDRLASVRKAIEKQTIVTEKPEDLDVIGMAGDELEAAVQVFFVRRGRVVGRKGFVLDLVEDVSPGELVGRVLEGLYAEADAADIPHQVLVPDLPDDLDVYREFLCEVRGSNVSIRVPQRGDKRALQETVTQNAKEEFVRHRLQRASDHNARARALTALQDALGLPDAPLRIECFDMSHIQGSDYVGSMVVMEDGLPKKSDYRRFRIKEVPGNDDFAAMEEVLTRRLTALIVERDRSLGDPGRSRKFAYPPNLLVVDGGKGQLSVAQRVVESLGLEEEISVAALAKRFEEVFVPGQADPIRIPRQSEALYMLQRLRDEAHRFAITYHRELRGKRMTTSVLDGITGLGETRKKRLVKELGGIKAVKSASLEDLQSLAVAARRVGPWPCTTRSTGRPVTGRRT